uniref:Uncharacterized protein n=1 Tax=Musa acuminata subsp. malaccensis TaxID=214687 RepID=A0A804L484_MUSAM
MLGIYLDMAHHYLNISPEVQPVKQKHYKFAPKR